jgi:hypothetical protein
MEKVEKAIDDLVNELDDIDYTDDDEAGED